MLTVIPLAEGKKEEEPSSSGSLTDGGEAYRQLLNTFRAAEGGKSYLLS